MTSRRPHGGFVCALAAVLVSACALPDLRPFADSTARLHAAVLKTESELPQLLREAGSPQADTFAAHLKVRTQAMNAVLQYTESLAHIAQAGASGSAAAGKVGDALNGLLGALKQAPITGQAMAVVELAYGAVSQVRAAGAFADAVERADPAVQSIAGILDKDLQAMLDLLPVLVVPMQTAVMDREKVRDLVDYRQQLERRRRQIESQLAAKPDEARFAALSRQAQEVGMLIDQTRDRYDPLVAEQRDIAARVAALRTLTGKARQAIAEWAAVHARLAADVRSGVRPNTAVLVSLALQIQSLADTGAQK